MARSKAPVDVRRAAPLIIDCVWCLVITPQVLKQPKSLRVGTCRPVELQSMAKPLAATPLTSRKALATEPATTSAPPNNRPRTPRGRSPSATPRGRSPSPTPRGRSPSPTRQPKAVTERPAFRGGRSSQQFNRLEALLSRCIASGPGLGTIVAGSEDTWFELRALEGTEPLDVDASRFQVSLKRQLTHRDLLPASQYLQTAGSSDRLPISVVPRLKETDDSLLVRYSPLSVAGTYHLTVLLDGQHIRRSPLALSVVPGATAQLRHAAAASCELCAGGEALLVLHACDRLGNRRTTGGDSLEVQLQGAEQAQVDCSVLDLRNGAYELRATAVGAGSYIGRVLLRSARGVGGGGKTAGGGGKAVGGGGGEAAGAWSTSPGGGEHTQPPASPPPAASPPLAFELCVHPHTSHAAACLVEELPRKGRELAALPPHESLPTHLTVDESVRLLLTVRDKFGNRRSDGGDGWTISLDEVFEGVPRPPPLPGSAAAQSEAWVWACEVQPCSLPLPPSLHPLCTSSAAHLHPLCTSLRRLPAP